MWNFGKWPSWFSGRVARPMGLLFSKWNGFLPGPEGRPQPKMKLIGSMVFEIFCTKDTHTNAK